MLLWHTGNSLLSFCIFFYATCKEGQFDVVQLVSNNQFKVFESINLNAEHVNGMTHFDLVEIHVRLLDIL